MTGGTTQWPDIGSIREGAADEAAHRCDRVCWESPKTTDTYWSARIYGKILRGTTTKIGDVVNFKCNCGFLAPKEHYT